MPPSSTPSFEFAPMPSLHFGGGTRHKFIDTLIQKNTPKLYLLLEKPLCNPNILVMNGWPEYFIK